MEPRVYGDRNFDVRGKLELFCETRRPRCFELLGRGCEVITGVLEYEVLFQSSIWTLCDG